jgi:hypothetical protein
MLPKSALNKTRLNAKNAAFRKERNQQKIIVINIDQNEYSRKSQTISFQSIAAGKRTKPWITINAGEKKRNHSSRNFKGDCNFI